MAKKAQFMVQAEGVTKIYNQGEESEVQALRGVDVLIEQGEFIGVMGPSGSGKSTLMHILGALDSPTAGTVSIGGEEISHRPVSKLTKIRANKVGFVFQSFNLLSTHTALENVMLAVDYSGRKANSEKEARAALGQVGLGKRVDHFPRHLSGGEQQRVAIARALVNKPALILADEPTGQLDTKTSQEIVELMKRLAKQNKETFVIVTHNPEVAQICDRIIHLRDGEVERVTKSKRRKA